MTPTLILTGIALAVQAVGIIVVAVWSISSIRTSARLTCQAVTHLQEAVDRLTSHLECVEQKQARHEARLSVLEHDAGIH